MKLRLLCRLLGLLLLLLCLAMGLCLGYAYWESLNSRFEDAMQPFFWAISITGISGVILFLCGLGADKELLRKEGITVVGLGWLLCSVFGALPYVFNDPALTPAQAWFESMSGFTTTGATVIVDLDLVSRSILLWRSLTQWLGGLGILVLFVALLTSIGAGSKSLFRHESSAKTGEGLQARISDVADKLWQIYISLTLICCLGLLALGMSLFDALCHTFTAISTGGFSPYNNSIAAFNSLDIELWLVLFMVLGGISFMLYAWMLRGRFERWKQEEETRYYLWILLGSTLVISMNLYLTNGNQSVLSALRVSIFQVVSIMSTTGFVTTDFNLWPPLSLVILILLMTFGGCAGSTAGGIKIGRWVYFFKIARQELIAAFRPNQVISLRLNGNITSEHFKTQTLFFLSLAGITVAFSTGLMTLLQPNLDIVSSLTAVTATLFNIGPGLGVVGPTHNFATFSPITLCFLSFLMVLGRLEFFAILVLFVPSLWRKY